MSAACYPEGHPESPDAVSDLRYLKQKVDAGAQHLVSQLFFDNEDFLRFLERARIAGITVPIEAGIMPVLNQKSIERMVSLCGASIPRKLSRILARYGDHPEALREAGIAYAIDQISDLVAAGVDGIHLYTMNNPAVARQISDSVSAIRRGVSAMPIALGELDLDEVLRYMGTPPSQAGPELRALAEECGRAVCAAARPRWAWRAFDIAEEADGVRLSCGLLLPGQDLKRHLRGCGRAAVFCATPVRPGGRPDPPLGERGHAAGPDPGLLRRRRGGADVRPDRTGAPGALPRLLLPFPVQPGVWGPAPGAPEPPAGPAGRPTAGGAVRQRQPHPHPPQVGDRYLGGRPTDPSNQLCAAVWAVPPGRAASIESQVDTVEFRELLNTPGPVLLDGGMGTMLQARGLSMGSGPSWPPWNTRTGWRTSTGPMWRRGPRSCAPTPSAPTGRSSAAPAAPWRRWSLPQWEIARRAAWGGP